MFCALGLIFGGTEGVGSRFHVLRSETLFRQYQGRRVPFSYFALSDMFLGLSTVGPVLRSMTHFRRYRGRLVPFSCFALPDSFSTVPRASGPFSCFALLDSFSPVP
jgi:hypothetical protein